MTVTDTPTASLELSWGVPVNRQSPSLPLVWTVSPELRQDLADREAFDPFLLVIISHRGREVSREAYRLDEGTRYVTFRNPGPNVVHAQIIWGKKGMKVPREIKSRTSKGNLEHDLIKREWPQRLIDLEAQERRLQRTGGKEDTKFEAVFGFPKSDTAQVASRLRSVQDEAAALREADKVAVLSFFIEGIHRVGPVATIDMTVDEAFFADEGSNFWITRQLAKLWIKDKPLDPCGVRKFAGYVLVCSPLYLLVGAIVLVVLFVWALLDLVCIAFHLLIGTRNLNYDVVLQPFENPKTIWESAKPSRWFTKQVEEPYGSESWTRTTYQKRAAWVQALNPLTLALSLAVVLVLHFFGTPGLGGLGLTGLLATAVITNLLVLVVVLGAVFYVRRLNQDDVQRRRREAESAKLEQRRQALLQELAPLANPVADERPTRLSFRLIYDPVKARFCQPFAQPPSD